MPLPRPIACVPLPDRGTVRLAFSDSEPGEYYMRGGISWPTATDLRDHKRPGEVIRRVIGHAVVAGLNVKTERLCVFDHTQYNAIDPGITADGRLTNEPLGGFLMSAWGVYGCDTFFWHDQADTYAVFAQAVYRSQSLRARPRFVFVPWEADGAAEQALWLASRSGASGFAVPADMTELAAREDGQQAKHALTCLVMGLQRFPYYRGGES